MWYNGKNRVEERKSMKISVCVPLYNEEKNVERCLRSLSGYMKETFLDGYEVIFINDGSKDRTEQIVKSFEDPAFRLISYPENRGKGYALRKGIAASGGDIIFFTDCDLAYGTDVIKTFYDCLTEHPEKDAAVGSRPKHPDGYKGYTFIRKLASRAYILILRIFGGLSLSDSQCGCKAFRGDVGRTVFSFCEVDRFAFDFEAILIGQKMGVRFTEIPVTVKNHGDSSVRVLRDTAGMLRDLAAMKKRIRALPLKKIR